MRGDRGTSMELDDHIMMRSGKLVIFIIANYPNIEMF
jgi:hypothetical protein